MPLSASCVGRKSPDSQETVAQQGAAEECKRDNSSLSAFEVYLRPTSNRTRREMIPANRGNGDLVARIETFALAVQSTVARASVIAAIVVQRAIGRGKIEI